MDNKLAKQNYDFCEETIKLKSTLEQNFIELAGRLKKIQDEKMYEPNYSSFSDFLADMNIQGSVATRLIQIYELFVIQFKFPLKRLVEAGGWSKLAEIKPVCNTKEEAEEWMNVALTNPKQAVRDMVQLKLSGRKSFPNTCDDFYIIKICRDSKAKYVLADTRDENYRFKSWHDGGQ